MIRTPKPICRHSNKVTITLKQQYSTYILFEKGEKYEKLKNRRVRKYFFLSRCLGFIPLILCAAVAYFWLVIRSVYTLQSVRRKSVYRQPICRLLAPRQ